MKSDGSIIIDTKILDDGMEKGFEALKNGMDSVGVTAEKVGKAIKLSFSEADMTKPIAAAVDKVKDLERELSEVTSQFDVAIKYDDDKEAARLGKRQESVYKQLETARRKLTRTIAQEARKAAEAERKEAERTTRIQKKEAEKQAKAAMKPINRFGTRLRSIVSGALLFNLISSGLREVTKYFGSALKSNEEFTRSFSQLKGALLTAFQPIYEVVAPAIVNLMDVLTAAIHVIGQFFASLSGKSYAEISKNAEALYNEANAINGVGSAAKKAQRQLAGFDQINKLAAKESESGTSSTISPVFGGKNEVNHEIIHNLKNILEVISSIGAALLTWKIASAFTGSLSTAAGLALTVGGALLSAYNWADAFSNGINWENLSGMLLGLTAVVGGLAIAFGSTGAAIGLIVGGISLAVLGLKEWIETGELTNEGLTALTAGVMALGVAISLLTGSWIPALIAAVVAAVVVIATRGDEIKGVLQKLSDWLNGVFAKDWRDLFGNGLGSYINGFFSSVKKYWDNTKKIFEGVIDFIGGVFSLDFDKAIRGLINIIQGYFGRVWTVLTAPFNITAETIRNIAQKILPESWKNGINSIIAMVNDFIGWLNRSMTFYIDPIKIAGKTIFSGGSLSLVTIPDIPYLAQGAVIPPNAPFMAVLGDQKNGTNVEAPLSTIQEAVAMVMQDQTAAIMAGFASSVEVQREILQAVLGIQIGDDVIAAAYDRYRTKLAVQRGG